MSKLIILIKSLGSASLKTKAIVGVIAVGIVTTGAVGTYEVFQYKQEKAQKTKIEVQADKHKEAEMVLATKESETKIQEESKKEEEVKEEIKEEEKTEVKEETSTSNSEEKVSNNTTTEVKTKESAVQQPVVEEKPQVKEPEKPQEPQKPQEPEKPKYQAGVDYEKSERMSANAIQMYILSYGDKNVEELKRSAINLALGGSPTTAIQTPWKYKEGGNNMLVYKGFFEKTLENPAESARAYPNGGHFLYSVAYRHEDGHYTVHFISIKLGDF